MEAIKQARGSDTVEVIRFSDTEFNGFITGLFRLIHETK